MNQQVADRKTAIHLLRSGQTVQEVAQELKRHPNWVRKWRRRYQTEGWAGLQDRSRAPRKQGHKLKDKVWRDICQARSELEAEAASGKGLKYVGPVAVRTKLKRKGLKPLPSKSTIERVLREHKMTRPYQKRQSEKVVYPHLNPRLPLHLCQVDIVPHYLQGGERVACFNAIDVVSRYPTGQAFGQRRAVDAANFLVHTWQQIGIPRYTQVDNEGCFSGGGTHPYVLGQVVRLALVVGTELLFSPIGHPESNGYVERFHQDYDLHVWQDTYLHNRQEVQDQADTFFQAYRQSEHHSALRGLSPQQCHQSHPGDKLPLEFVLPEGKLPLVEGPIHFIRRVATDGTVRVLNVTWPVPPAYANRGVWVTLEVASSGATLYIYDAAPDVAERQCLTVHPFPLNEPVLSRKAVMDDILQTSIPGQIQPVSGDPPNRSSAHGSSFFFVTLLSQATRLASRIFHTIY